ncbi:hypothetical protein BV20DRAFT_1112661 [Pilatotrama ljubarskyi]|nr:hypothetical protein BV20DRAFT_1112661 [Pilatotrama ljubarskyi]
MKGQLLVALACGAIASAGPGAFIRRTGNCTNQPINDLNAIEAISNPFAGFNWDGFGFESCPDIACHSFPANVAQQFTPPRLAMAEGLVGSVIIHKIDSKTSPKGSFTPVDTSGSFDLGPFDVFDIVDLPVRFANECTPAGDGDHVRLAIPFDRNKSSAGYSATADKLGSQFVGLSSCTITTTQVFFPLGQELEIPTENMGCALRLSKQDGGMTTVAMVCTKRVAGNVEPSMTNRETIEPFAGLTMRERQGSRCLCSVGILQVPGRQAQLESMTLQESPLHVLV